MGTPKGLILVCKHTIKALLSGFVFSGISGTIAVSNLLTRLVALFMYTMYTIKASNGSP